MSIRTHHKRICDDIANALRPPASIGKIPSDELPRRVVQLRLTLDEIEEFVRPDTQTKMPDDRILPTIRFLVGEPDKDQVWLKEIVALFPWGSDMQFRDIPHAITTNNKMWHRFVQDVEQNLLPSERDDSLSMKSSISQTSTSFVNSQLDPHYLKSLVDRVGSLKSQYWELLEQFETRNNDVLSLIDDVEALNSRISENTDSGEALDQQSNTESGTYVEKNRPRTPMSNLKRLLARQEDEFSKLKEKLQNSEQEVHRLAAQSTDTESRSAMETKDLRSRVVDLETELTQLRSSNAEQATVLQMSTDENSTLRGELECLKSKESGLEDQLKASQTENEHLKTDFERTRAVVAEKTNIILQLQDDITRHEDNQIGLRKQILKHQAETKDCEIELSNAQAERQKLVADLEGRETEMTQRLDTITSLQSNIKTLEDRQTGLQGQIEKLKSQNEEQSLGLDRIQKENQDIQTDSASKDTQLNEKVKIITKLQDNIKLLEDTLAKLRAEIETQKKVNEGLEQLNGVCKTEHSTLTQDNKALQEQIDELKTGQGNLLTEKEKLIQSESSLKAQLDTAHEDIEVLQVSINKIRSELTQQSNEKEALATEQEEAKAEYENRIAALIDEKAHLIQLKSALETQVGVSQEKIEELQTLYHTWRDSHAVAAKSIEALSVDITEAQKQYESRIESLLEENSKILQSKSTLDTEVEASQTRIVELQELVDKWRASYETAMTENRALSEKFEEASSQYESRLDTLAQERKALTEASETNLTELIANHDTSIEKLQQDISELHAKNDAERNKLVQELTDTKATHSVKLQEVVDSHKDAAQKIQQEFDETMESLRTTHKTHTENLIKTHDIALKEMNEQNAAKTSDLQRLHEEQKSSLQITIDRLQSEMDALAEAHQASQHALSQSHLAEIQVLARTHTTREEENEQSTSRLQREHNDQVANLQAEISRLSDGHITEMQRITDKHERDMQAVLQTQTTEKKTHKRSISGLQQDYDTKISGLDATIRRLKLQVADLVQEHEIEKQFITGKHERDMQTALETHITEKKTHKRSISQLQEDYDTRIMNLDATIKQLNLQLAELQENHGKEKQTLIQTHAEEKDALNRFFADKQKKQRNEETLKDLSNSPVLSDGEEGVIKRNTSFPRLDDYKLMQWQDKRTQRPYALVTSRSFAEGRSRSSTTSADPVWFKGVFFAPFQIFGEDGRRLETNWTSQLKLKYGICRSNVHGNNDVLLMKSLDDPSLTHTTAPPRLLVSSEESQYRKSIEEVQPFPKSAPIDDRPALHKRAYSDNILPKSLAQRISCIYT